MNTFYNANLTGIFSHFPAVQQREFQLQAEKACPGLHRLLSLYQSIFYLRLCLSAVRIASGRLPFLFRARSFGLRHPNNSDFASGDNERHSCGPYEKAGSRQIWSTAVRSHHLGHGLSGNRAVSILPNLCLIPIVGF